MKKQGFTLVELLAVIVIVAIIMVIATPSTFKIIKKSKNDAYQSQKQLIVDAAKKYVMTSMKDISWVNDTAEITLSALQLKGLLPNPLKNPKGGEFSSLETKVLVTKSDNNYTYLFVSPDEPLPDTESPVILLNGSNPMPISVGGTYTEPGATATDNVDGDISANIQISGTVNTAVAGTYTITYSVTDSSGNETTTTRTVNVASAPPSGGGGGGGL